VDAVFNFVSLPPSHPLQLHLHTHLLRILKRNPLLFFFTCSFIHRLFKLGFLYSLSQKLFAKVLQFV